MLEIAGALPGTTGRASEAAGTAIRPATNRLAKTAAFNMMLLVIDTIDTITGQRVQSFLSGSRPYFPAAAVPQDGSARRWLIGRLTPRTPSRPCCRRRGSN